MTAYAEPVRFQARDRHTRDVTEREPLSREQVDALLGFMRSDAVYHRYIDEVVILLGTAAAYRRCAADRGGHRPDEQGDFRQAARSRGRRGYRVDEPKTESGRRYIYMTDEVMAAFEHVMAWPKAKPLNVDGRTGFIFLNRDGLPRVGGDYDRVFRGLRGKYTKEGKDESSRWHDTAYAASHVLHGDGEGRDEPEGAAIHHGP